MSACSDCTMCESEYTDPATLQTVTTSGEYCGRRSDVKEYEDFFESEAKEAAFYDDASAIVTCTRFDNK